MKGCDEKNEIFESMMRTKVQIRSVSATASDDRIKRYSLCKSYIHQRIPVCIYKLEA